MITAHVNEQGMVLRFESLSDNLSSNGWQQLLDELPGVSTGLPTVAHPHLTEAVRAARFE